MISKTSDFKLRPFTELWHCGRCDVMFDQASADQSSGVVACPQCGTVNLGYCYGPRAQETEEVQVIPDPPAPAPADADRKRGPFFMDLLELLKVELAHVSKDEQEAVQREKEAHERWFAAREENRVAAYRLKCVKDLIEAIEQPPPEVDF